MSIGNMRNPLESHTFRRLLGKVEMVGEFDGNTVKLQRFEYVRFNYRKWEEEESVWSLMTFLQKTEELDRMSRELGLLKIDTVHVCVSCMTSEYVRDDKDNGLVCKRCGTIYKGWE